MTRPKWPLPDDHEKRPTCYSDLVIREFFHDLNMRAWMSRRCSEYPAGSNRATTSESVIQKMALQTAASIGARRPRRCRTCGCTETDNRACVEAQGFPCWWTAEDLCSRCDPEARSEQRSEPPPGIVEQAVLLAGWSECRNSQRGAVVFDLDEQVVLGMGVNGLPGDWRCRTTCSDRSCGQRAVHAEAQAILHAGAKARGRELLHVQVVGGQMVASRRPRCAPCAALAMVAGIEGVWLLHGDGWWRYEANWFYSLSIRGDA